MSQSPTSQQPTLTHRQLSLFRAIMVHGSLNRAAQACATSQPTLSRELARMEQQLDFALFDRVRGRLRPTLRSLALFQEVERSFILNPAVTLSSRSDLADTKAAEGG